MVVIVVVCAQVHTWDSPAGLPLTSSFVFVWDGFFSVNELT